jgi:peroxiredoxin
VLKNIYSKWQSLRRNRLYRYAIDLTVLLVFIIGLRAYVSRDLIKGIAPQIQAKTLQGQSVNLHESDPRPLLLHFWASWCPICSLEEDNIERLSKDYNVITVAMQSGDADEVHQYLKEHNLTFPVINDPEGVISQSYGLRGVPSSFIIDAKNQIRFSESGYTSGVGLQLRLWLAKFQ